MRITAAGATDVGRIRESNEDSFLIDQALGLYIVCDGMGGHAAGEIASERAIAFASQFIRDRIALVDNAEKVPGGYFRVAEMIESAMQFASAKLHDMGMSNSDYRGMGTTMTLLLIRDSKAIMGHVGDSRLYVLREDRVHQLSSDHTLANEMLLSGDINPDSEIAERYSHVLTRAIGTQETVQVETLLFDLFPNDVCILCSDGLSNYFSKASKLKELIRFSDLPSAPRTLIDFACQEGGVDNITAITLVADHDQTSSSDAEVVRQRLKLLKSSFLCKGISESRAMRLLNHSSVVCASAGQKLVAKDSRDAGIYFVRRGRVIVELPNGDEIEIGEEECFGETSLANGGRAMTSATIIEDVELQFVSCKRFESLTKRFPKLGRQLYKNLAFEICNRYLSHLTDSATWMEDTFVEEDNDFDSNVDD